MQERLVDRHPEVPADQLVAQMVPPPMFDEVSFASYIPDPKEPSQAAAVAKAEEFAGQVAKIHKAASKKSLFGKKKAVSGAGLYLIQRDVPELVRTSAFARSETLLQ
ncbi:hypothetical protein ACFWF3_34335, partial [Nocardia sp. NPDC060220]